jgi:hypothetical protein
MFSSHAFLKGAAPKKLNYFSCFLCTVGVKRTHAVSPSAWFNSATTEDCEALLEEHSVRKLDLFSNVVLFSEHTLDKSKKLH